ncbi:MAG: hypothetical protein WCP22_00950 [Chlamydiota bacterium]
MSARHRMTIAVAALAAACWCIAPECPGGQSKPLSITPSSLTAGKGFSFDVRLNAPISAHFDVYCIADTSYGVFNLFFSGWVSYAGWEDPWSIEAVCPDVWGYEFPYATRVRPRVTIPMDMRYNFITFYLYITPAGKVPIFYFIEELGPNTGNVVMFDSVRLPVR